MEFQYFCYILVVVKKTYNIDSFGETQFTSILCHEIIALVLYFGGMVFVKISPM